MGPGGWRTIRGSYTYIARYEMQQYLLNIKLSSIKNAFKNGFISV